MKFSFLKTVAISFWILLLFGGLGWAQTHPIYSEAPYNGFEKKGIESREAQSLKVRFHENSGGAYSEGQLRPLTEKDFINIDNVSLESLERAKKLFQSGKVVVVDSVVGNATRLGNPPGGKGAVVIGEQITFLDAKIIRLAVDSSFVGRDIKQILWTSEENMGAVSKLLNSLDSRLDKMSSLSSELKATIRKYIRGQNIVLMAQSTLLPVIDKDGRLSEERFRNLGAGEMVPTIYRSGADELVGLRRDSILVFSNIDFDLSYLHVVAASLEADRPDLMQVHIKTKASGGSAYWLKDGDSWRIVPLEGIEVPASVLEKATTLNSNTVVMQGRALDPKNYENLPLPFEEKEYEGRKFYLPKLSLSDIGKDKSIRTAVAIGDVNEYFFAGSKNSDLLARTGPEEIRQRISRWQTRIKVEPLLKIQSCGRVLLKAI